MFSLTVFPISDEYKNLLSIMIQTFLNLITCFDYDTMKVPLRKEII
jgi:hypothetical protein